MPAGKKKKDKKEKKPEKEKVKKGKKGERGSSVTGTRPASEHTSPIDDAPATRMAQNQQSQHRHTSYQYSTNASGVDDQYIAPTVPAYEDTRFELQPGFRETQDGLLYECPEGPPDEGAVYEEPSAYTSDNGPILPPRSGRFSTISDVSMSSAGIRVSHISQMSAASAATYNGSSSDEEYHNIPGDPNYQNPDDKTMSLRRSVSTTQGAIRPVSTPMMKIVESDLSSTGKLYRGKRKPKFCVDAAEFLPSVFECPWAIAVSPVNGDIYLTDIERCQVIRFHKGGQLLDRIGSRGTGEGEFRKPCGVALSSDGKIVVSDELSNCIQVFDGNGSFIRRFGCEGSGNGQFRRPTGIAISGDDKLFVADQWNHRIQVWRLTGELVRIFGCKGTGIGQYAQPNDVAVTLQGDVIIADTNNHRLHVVTPEGSHVSVIGGRGTENGQLSYPKSVAVDRTGYCIVADVHNHRVHIFNPNGEFVHCFGSRGTEEGEFDQLTGVAVNLSTNDIFVSDHFNKRIQIF